MPGIKFNNIEEYESAFPENTRKRLKEFKQIIKEVVPAAEEAISYNMPAIKLNGILVWYAAHAKHIGFYPRPSAIKFFANELVMYKTSKGAIQFPFEKKLPKTLVKKIVQFRLHENLKKQKKK